MICEACRNDRCEECSDPDCECISRMIERELASVSAHDATIAEVVLNNILGNPIARMIVDGAGESKTRCFVGLVVRTYKALQC